MTTKIHDSGYKKLFSNPTILRQLLETFVAQPWVKELDFDQCQTIEKNFISDHYKETESDLIYRIALHNQVIYIYILLEFQSTVDPFMVVRILNYLTNFYLDYIASHKKIKQLPAILPLVLYNGKQKWTAKRNVDELIESSLIGANYLPHFQYLLIEENRYSQEQLLAIRNIVSTLFLAEVHYDLALLEDEMLNLFDQETDKQAVSLFLNWFKQLSLHGRVSPADYDQLNFTYQTREEVKTMLVATLERERQKIYQTGLNKGRVEGRVEERQTMILQLAALRFELTEREKQAIWQAILPISDLEGLATATTYLMQAGNVRDFVAFLSRPGTINHQP